MVELLVIGALLLATCLGAAVAALIVLYRRLASLEQAERVRQRQEKLDGEREKLKKIQASAVYGSSVVLHPHHPDADVPEPDRRKGHLGLYIGGGVAVMVGGVRTAMAARPRAVVAAALTMASAATASTLLYIGTVPQHRSAASPPSVFVPTGAPTSPVLVPPTAPSPSSSPSATPSTGPSGSPSVGSSAAVLPLLAGSGSSVRQRSRGASGNGMPAGRGKGRGNRGRGHHGSGGSGNGHGGGRITSTPSPAGLCLHVPLLNLGACIG